MFNKIRHFIAYRLALKAVKLTETGEFAKIMKGLSYLQYSLIILPDCEAKYRTIEEMQNLANKKTLSEDEGLI